MIATPPPGAPSDASTIAAVYGSLGIPAVSWGASAGAVDAALASPAPAPGANTAPGASFPLRTSAAIGSCRFAVSYIGGPGGLTDVQVRHEARGEDGCFDHLLSAVQSALGTGSRSLEDNGGGPKRTAVRWTGPGGFVRIRHTVTDAGQAVDLDLASPKGSTFDQVG